MWPCSKKGSGLAPREGKEIEAANIPLHTPVRAGQYHLSSFPLSL